MGKSRDTGNLTSKTNLFSDVVNDRVGIGTTNPTSKLTVQGDVLVSGISTLGTVQISSGIVTATTGIVTYYGDGGRLINIPSPVMMGMIF